MLPILILFVALCLSFADAVDKVVSLTNGKYQGTVLGNGLTSWLGIRYAAAPVGSLRFAAPQDPPGHEGIEAANSQTQGCMGLGPQVGGSEDCLFLDVYAPTETTNFSKLPVYVFIQGGGFNGDGAHPNASGLISASGMHLITVSFTYRGGALGFLASTEVQRGASLNNGLKDQRKVLEWVQLNIAAFGGDANHVTLGGQSAGAGSVTQHLVAYGGRNDNLFHAAVAQSQSFPAVRTVAQSQYQYDHLVSRANCSSSSNTLACLRSLSIAAFQAANLNEPFPNALKAPIFPYNPVLDNDFVTDYPIRSFTSGKFLKVPTIFGDDTNEGTIFADQSITTAADSEAFLVDQFPSLNATQLAHYNTMYTLNDAAPAPYWHHVSAAYGETRYICPGIVLSTVMAAHNVPTWNYRYDVLDPVAVAVGLNVQHGAEMPAIWWPEGAAPASYYTTNRNIVPVMQGYWTSFIRSFDPDTHRAEGSPEWEQWGAGRRLRLVADGSAMEGVVEAQKGRCAYISGIEVEIDQ
ncbi:hypothetical protein MMC11_000816 [Xylographa trunciseda]|nr:hypothetical protein [Xylographa trunciseda]